MNVVFHLSSGTESEVRHALANVSNLRDDETVETESVTLLANGDAVSYFLGESPVADRIESLLGDGVRCRVCQNSLDTRNIDAASLVAGAEVVPSGVGELVTRQAAGDAYLKVP
ncbi:hypothetical protein GJR96_11455 [Haloferax sp. MBLA0076]|uniref:Uncharacterized protein n=1 Tax=Haloferax litoreum TaxID=2666140 RepID=A0A6A8GKH0_9EURY|nr:MULTISPECIES: DsrE family protein [Haloferax]KAB1194018.1 hypothetical protein Hfx1148_11405 [Haloferax sp. CBA1148]MRX22567.1 hypothetical protein [Haloferax litoreum]